MLVIRLLLTGIIKSHTHRSSTIEIDAICLCSATSSHLREKKNIFLVGKNFARCEREISAGRFHEIPFQLASSAPIIVEALNMTGLK